MASLTTAEMRQAVLDLTNEVLTPTIIDSWFIMGLRRMTPYIRKEAWWYHTITAGEITAVTKRFLLPTDFYKPVEVSLIRSTFTRFLQPRILNDESTNGYRLWRKEILINNTLLLADQIDLYYYGLPTIADIPEGFEWGLVSFAAAKSQQRGEELDEKNDFYRDFLEVLGELDKFTSEISTGGDNTPVAMTLVKSDVIDPDEETVV